MNLEKLNVLNDKFSHNILFYIVLYFSEKNNFKSYPEVKTIMESIGITNIKFHFGIFNPITNILNRLGFNFKQYPPLSIIIKARMPRLLFGNQGTEIDDILESIKINYKYYIKPKSIYLEEDLNYDIDSCMMMWKYDEMV